MQTKRFVSFDHGPVTPPDIQYIIMHENIYTHNTYAFMSWVRHLYYQEYQVQSLLTVTVNKSTVKSEGEYPLHK